MGHALWPLQSLEHTCYYEDAPEVLPAEGERAATRGSDALGSAVGGPSPDSALPFFDGASEEVRCFASGNTACPAAQRKVDIRYLFVLAHGGHACDVVEEQREVAELLAALG